MPLHDGMDDASYTAAFRPILQRVNEVFQPNAIVLQCGADSLAADRLGCFNLSHAGHSECVRLVKNLGLPLLVTGGGGYTKSNVARCWTHETATILDQQLDDHIPEHDFYYQYYEGGDHRLNVPPSGVVENLNSRSYLQGIKQKVFEQLRGLEGAPSVAMHRLPPDAYLPSRRGGPDGEDEPEQNF